MHPIVVAPKLPGRFYFIFGKPIETRGKVQGAKYNGTLLILW
jgi:hypothetical protein